MPEEGVLPPGIGNFLDLPKQLLMVVVSSALRAVHSKCFETASMLEARKPIEAIQSFTGRNIR